MTVKVTVLDNGLRVATDTMPDADSVVAGAWVAAGTRDEPVKANGVAHLVEHMMFKGTTTRSSFALSAAIENNGGSANAYTTREETAYYARVLPEDTALALDVIADMLLRSVFDAKELEREKQVVIQEIGRDRDTPEDYLYDVMYEKAFPHQHIGRPVLGEADVIAAMPRAAIVDYVKKHYNASTMVIVAAGRVDHDNFVTLVQHYFGKLKGGKTASRDKARVKHGSATLEKDSEQLHLLMAFSGVGIQSPALPAMNVLSTLLGGSASSRLFQKIREKRGLVYAISSSHSAFTDSGLFQIYAGTDPNRIGELIPAVCREMVDVTTHVTRGELARAKAQICAELRMGRENVMNRADRLGHQMLVFGKHIPVQTTLQRYEAVTKDDVEMLARQMIKKSPVVAAIGPLGKMESYAKTVARLRA